MLALATAFGLAALLSASPLAYKVVQYAGAAYLVYLGYDLIASKDDTRGELEAVNAASLWRIFYQGVLVEILNPKTMLFFLAFIPQFIDQDRGSFTLQMLVLGVLVPLTAVGPHRRHCRRHPGRSARPTPQEPDPFEVGRRIVPHRTRRSYSRRLKEYLHTSCSVARAATRHAEQGLDGLVPLAPCEHHPAVLEP